MPHRIPFFGTDARCLWLVEGASAWSIQAQDGNHFSQQFPVTALQVEAVATGMIAALAFVSPESNTVLRLRWSNSMLIAEYEDEAKSWQEECAIHAFIEALS